MTTSDDPTATGVTNAARASVSRRLILGGLSSAAALGLGACTISRTDASPAPGATGGAGSSGTASGSPSTSTASPVTFTPNVSPDKPVPVDTVVTVTSTGGTINNVEMTYLAKGQTVAVEGAVGADGVSWTASSLLEPGVTYSLQMSGSNAAGVLNTGQATFSTQNLTLKQQVFPTIIADGATVGIGMPVIVKFDLPITNRAAIEKRLTVTSTPAQNGAWGWVSNNEVHWRPENFWQPGTTVSINVAINGVNAGNGLYGQKSVTGGFTVGRSVVVQADLAAHQMQAVIDGQVARTMPCTGGKPGYVTRSGTKILMEKFTTIRMDAATTGVDPKDPEYYDIADVRFAMRETYSGEFIHAAPWSVASQGRANVSHGCIGLSLANAEWLFNQCKVGDPIVVTGTSRPLDSGNGWTDFNVTFPEWQKKSALTA